MPNTSDTRGPPPQSDFYWNCALYAIRVYQVVLERWFSNELVYYVLDLVDNCDRALRLVL